MKRSLVAIVTIIYFTISSGVVMNIHYCMGRVSSVELDNFSKKTHGCGKSENNGCCKTELKIVKLEDAQKASYADFSIHIPVTLLFADLNLLQTPFYNAQTFVHSNQHSPPLLSGQDIYLQNCVFRI